MEDELKFGKWRKVLWPIHSNELKKVIPMLLIFFGIMFNYTLLRNLKDGLIINAPGSGAEVIPFLKVWCMPIGAFGFMYFYIILSNILDRERLFYYAIMPFLLFYILFSHIIIPFRMELTPDHLVRFLSNNLPESFQTLIVLIKYWYFTVFYVVSEIWGSAVGSLMFWGFANDITKISEAKRFYALLGLGANLALIFQRPIVQTLNYYIPDSSDPGVLINVYIAIIIFVGIGILLLYRYMNCYVLTDPTLYSPDEVKNKKNKKKLSFMQSMKFILSSKHLLLIALIVLSYGFSIILIEVAWKAQIKQVYSTPKQWLDYMSMNSLWLGFATVFMMIFISSNVIRAFGWFTAASITPTMMFLTGLPFCMILIFEKELSTYVNEILGMTPLMLSIYLGSMHNISTKSAKYSLFDPTKEIAYIPLDPESRTKGKAAIDVLASRLGKSGGSLSQQLLILYFGSIILAIPIISILILLVVITWLYGNFSLGLSLKKYDKKI